MTPPMLVAVLVVSLRFMVCVNALIYIHIHQSKGFLSDIKRVLLVGGSVDFSVGGTQNVWLIDLEAGNHCQVADYPVPVEGAAGALLHDVKYLRNEDRGAVVCGGPEHINNCFYYDIEDSKQWEHFDDNLVIGRYYPSSSRLYDGSWLIAGGVGNDIIGMSSEIFNMKVSKTFREGPDLPESMGGHCQVTNLNCLYDSIKSKN